MKWLALILVLVIPAPAQAEQAVGSAAASLPFLDGSSFEAQKPPTYREFQREEQVKDSTCAVSADQLPPEFLNLMKHLDEPVVSTETGLPPVVGQVAPAAAAQAQTRRRSGIQILHGSNSEVKHGRSRENGVTVYRGLEPERR